MNLATLKYHTTAMTPLFKKLNFKEHPRILVLNHPDSFLSALEAMKDATEILTDVQATEGLAFAIFFATRQDEVDTYGTAISDKMEGDGILWVAYPKKSSRRYQCEFNRDTGWSVLGAYGWEPVRIVAIDEDWSALRFRRVKFIKKITRKKSFALTKEAKRRTTNKKE